MDAAQCAELRSNGAITHHVFLREAVIAFYRLPEAEQARATITIQETGAVYRAATIRRLHDVVDDDRPAPAT